MNVIRAIVLFVWESQCEGWRQVASRSFYLLLAVIAVGAGLGVTWKIWQGASVGEVVWAGVFPLMIFAGEWLVATLLWKFYHSVLVKKG